MMSLSEQKKKIILTPVGVLHYVRLVYRSALFVAALVLYIIGRVTHNDAVTDILQRRPMIVRVIWLVYFVEMLMRFFPSRLESPGCQKQFSRNYIKSGSTDIDVQDNNATMLVAIIWVSFNCIFGALYRFEILDDGIMILLCCAYAICDMICILFFCPFQTWLLKNKCCSTCRIYNWDYAMMFTPLLFTRSIYSWTLLFMSLLLMIRWEITFYRYPERFSEKTNDYLRCANCTEKLCAHKKQLRTLWTRIAEFTEQRTAFLKK